MSAVPRPKDATEYALPPAIAQVLRQVPGQFRVRLLRVLTAASRAVSRLRELDISPLEQRATYGEGTDLAMWELVAPSVAASIAEVNELLTVIDEHIPPAPEAEEDDFDLAFSAADQEKTSPHTATEIPTSATEREGAAQASIRAMASSLRAEVSRFGERLRNPSVMTDRWNLLCDIQEFRGRCRAAISELVYSACSTFAEVRRPDVVPEYDTSLRESLEVRRAVTTLARALAPLHARLQATSVDTQRGPCMGIHRELRHFRSTRGFMQMRAGDKRFVLEFARDLDSLLAGEGPRDARQLVEGFVRFLDSLAVINRREILINHDREAFAECGMLLEQASQLAADDDLERASERFQSAVQTAFRLFGRDRSLDDYLLVRLRWPAEQINGAAISEAVEELLISLAEVSSHASGPIF